MKVKDLYQDPPKDLIPIVHFNIYQKAFHLFKLFKNIEFSEHYACFFVERLHIGLEIKSTIFFEPLYRFDCKQYVKIENLYQAYPKSLT